MAWQLATLIGAARNLRWNTVEGIADELAAYWRINGKFPDTPDIRTLFIEPELRELLVFEERTFFVSEEDRQLVIQPEDRALQVAPDNREASSPFTPTVH